MAIKLHYHPLSTYSRRVLIALIEKQISYEPVPLDMTARKHREPPYLALNPYGRVPTLEEDGFVLYESTAILDYLEATHPIPALAPSEARGRALVDMHMKLCDLICRSSSSCRSPRSSRRPRSRPGPSGCSRARARSRPSRSTDQVKADRSRCGHGRASSGHPRLPRHAVQIVDARHKSLPRT